MIILKINTIFLYFLPENKTFSKVNPDSLPLVLIYLIFGYLLSTQKNIYYFSRENKVVQQVFLVGKM